MNITRHNYEEFFILYLDNELDGGQRREVEAFAEANPDLRTELDLLLQTRLSPDASIAFPDKAALVKENTNLPANYEEMLLSYIDDELVTADRKEVEKWAAINVEVKKELNLFAQAKVEADNRIVFPDKASLYRKEERRVVALPWRRIAVAAAIILAVSVGAFVTFREGDNNASMAGNNEVKKIETDNKIVPQNNPAVNGNEKQPEIAKAMDEIKTDSKNVPVAPVVNEVDLKNEIAEVTPEKIVTPERKKDNQLPQPTHNPNVKGDIEVDQQLARLEVPDKAALTIQKEIKQLPLVTPTSVQPYNNVIAAANITDASTDEANLQEPAKKNKLRGFFRKVTRTFEKTTNIKATDDEDRLLIGGLAIRL